MGPSSSIGGRRKYEHKVWRRHGGEDNVNIEVATELFFSNVLSKVESQHQQQVLWLNKRHSVSPLTLS